MHRLDPRTKLLASLIFMIALLLTNDITAILALTLVGLVAVYVSEIPAGIVLKNLKWFFWLFLLTFAIHLLQVKTISEAPFLQVSIAEHGVTDGVIYTLRLMLLIVFSALLTLTTSPNDLTEGMERLFGPLKRFKLPVHEFSLMMTLALRFIPILIREAERIKNAQLSRGASLRGHLYRRVKSLIPMLIPLFVAAFRRADELALAMEARSYVGGEGRTSFNRLALKAADFSVLALSFSCLLGLIFLEIGV